MASPRPPGGWTYGLRRAGADRVALGFAALFVLFALASPAWSITVDRGGDRDTTSYGWATVTTEEFEDGAWDRTVVQPYSSPNFDDRSLASALGTSYLLNVLYAVVLVIVLFLFSKGRMGQAPASWFLLPALLVVFLALAAVFVPLLTVPASAAADLGLPIGGFWGTTTTATPPTTVTWGAGLGWWLTALAAFFGILGGAWPYVRRSLLVPPPPVGSR